MLVAIIILTIIFEVIYHKIFHVTYFSGYAMLKELFTCFILAIIVAGMIMKGWHLIKRKWNEKGEYS